MNKEYNFRFYMTLDNNNNVLNFFEFNYVYLYKDISDDLSGICNLYSKRMPIKSQQFYNIGTIGYLLQINKYQKIDKVFRMYQYDHLIRNVGEIIIYFKNWKKILHDDNITSGLCSAKNECSYIGLSLDELYATFLLDKI